MDKIVLRKQIKSLFPTLSQIELVDEIIANSQYLKMPAKFEVMQADSIIQVIPIVISGSINVVREGNTGSSVFLYYIKAGESCALTLSSCLKREKSQIKAVVESGCEILAIPVNIVYDFVHKYPSWNDFVIHTYSNRFEEMLNLVDNVCFYNIDNRLIQYLLSKQKIFQNDILIISHQEIATDLATSREVISRLLKQLERKNAILLGRGKVTILNLSQLLKEAN